MDKIIWWLLILVFQKSGCQLVTSPMAWINAWDYCSSIGKKLKCVSSEMDYESFGENLQSRNIRDIWGLNTTKIKFERPNNIGCSDDWRKTIRSSKDFETEVVYRRCHLFCFGSGNKYFTIYQNKLCYCLSSLPDVYCTNSCNCNNGTNDVRVFEIVTTIVECSKIRLNESEICFIQTSSCNDSLPFICETNQKCNAKLDVTSSTTNGAERVSACTPLHKYSTTTEMFSNTKEKYSISSEASSTRNDTFSTSTDILSSPPADSEGTIAAVVAVIVVVVIIGVVTVVCVVLRKRKNIPKSKADLSTHNVQNQSYDKQGTFDTTSYAAIAEPVLYSEPIINGTKGQGEQMNSVNNKDYRQTSDKTGNDEGEYIENFQNNYDHLGAKSERKRLPDGPNHMYAHAQIGTSYSEYDTTRSVMQDIELGVYDNPKSSQ